MFVAAFSRPEAESEPVLAEERQRGRGLGDDGRVVAPDVQVTAVIRPRRSVALATAPRTDQANEAWPCSSIQGEKWSEMAAKSKPTCSARRALWTRSEGPCSSDSSL